MSAGQTRDLFERAAKFYDGYPTGQYDEEAAHALRNHFDLLEVLESLIDGYENTKHTGLMDMLVCGSDIIKACAVIAKVKGGVR